MRSPAPHFLLILSLLAGDALAAPKLQFSKDQLEELKGTGKTDIPANELPPPKFGTKEVSGQLDAFKTASEQATYLQVYQMLYSQYGVRNPDHPKIIAETAKAIDDCVNGRPCDSNAQADIFRALSQYNFGQELKRQALTNSTNREKMKSLEGDEGDQSKIWEVAHKGASLAGGKVTPIETEISHQTNRDPYFQIDEESVKRKAMLNPAEIEALGPAFLKDYREFVNGVAATSKEPRRYKYIKPNSGEAASVYASDGKGNPVVADNAAQIDEINREQNAPLVKKATEDFLKNAKPLKLEKQDDGLYTENLNESSKQAGFGTFSPRDRKVLGPDGKTVVKVEAMNKSEVAGAVAKEVNEVFKDTYEENLKKTTLADNGGSSRTPASETKRNVDLSLDPEKFDAFLDKIWPSSATRKKIASDPVYIEKLEEAAQKAAEAKKAKKN